METVKNLLQHPYVQYLLLALLIFGIGYQCSRRPEVPRDEHGQSTLSTNKERRLRDKEILSARQGMDRKQFEADSIYNATKTKRPTSLNAATLSRADSIIRADLGY